MVAAAWKFDLGATVFKEGGTRFRVWAPKSQSVNLLILSGKAAGAVPMQQEEMGYYSVTVPGVGDGDRYLYQLDNGKTFPDPVSRYQPDGVHEPSQVVDPDLFEWGDEGWAGIPLEQYRIYEIHVGTFTREGTFQAAIPFLDYLVDLGITAVEIMPVSQCPGKRNWGYDGVFHFAPQNSFGGPGGLKRLVNACHKKGLAVLLDVVYNHFGPEGNYLWDFGHYFTDKYRTPWGRAMNLDGAYSDSVLEFFLLNAGYWINEFRFDGLRLDAVDWIFDQTPKPLLQRLAEEVHLHRKRLGREIFLFAENDTNDARLIKPPELCGFGLDAQWLDNFHHALRTMLTRETTGYYEDYGQFGQMVKSFEEAFVFTGEYSAYRKRRQGGSAKDRPTSQFVVFSQNHDQVGNRKCGDRLSASLPLGQLLLVAGVVILSPYIPLLFMGEEYGEKAPFHYFIDHSDPELIELVRKGKHEEHASGICEGEIPDPAAEETFLESKIDLVSEKVGEQAVILEFYKKLFSLRSTLPALQVFQREQMEVFGLNHERVLCFRRWSGENSVLCLFSFNNMQQEISLRLTEGKWEKLLDSSSQHWRGPGDESPTKIEVTGEPGDIPVSINPFSVVVYAADLTGGAHGAS
ncbi:Malto-oligosyltrehalose trehalohydrolase [Citrifermentans bremense]|uniref:Malto-oligosyltrehalose trehalohydrolase n=1 Tax=Citrifermentans bremense TaxID=60035 RepID=A0A6S6LTV3_9BACT|nr:malto-oligosyltrehalose trehalohydrolase [Citrifermentans bremense]BCG45367.1 Malto-oligosyltrehalose trehalohydrolase [Citrifermentans bremense]